MLGLFQIVSVERIKLLELSAEVFIYCSPVCLVARAYFPRSNKQAMGESPSCTSDILLASTSERKLSCFYFPSTRFHPFGHHPMKLLSFPSTRDPKAPHVSRVARSSDLHAGSLIPLPCIPPRSSSPLSSMNGRLRSFPQPQCHDTRAKPSARGI